jgi:hypothetical protein
MFESVGEHVAWRSAIVLGSDGICIGAVGDGGDARPIMAREWFCAAEMVAAVVSQAVRVYADADRYQHM